MYQLSDSDTTDSDDGIRFKTATTRDKQKSHNSKDATQRQRKRSGSRSRERTRRRSRSKSPRRHSGRYRTHRRSRSRSKDERRKMKSPTASIRSKESSSSRRSHDSLKKRSRSKSKDRRNVKSFVDNSADSLRNEESSGPVLPPDLQKSSNSNDKVKVMESIQSPSKSVHSEKTDDTLNDKNVCGPALPPHLVKTSETNVLEKQNEPVEDVCGPALPPHLLKQNTSSEMTTKDSKEEKSLGPFIPEHLRKQLAEESANITISEDMEEIHGDDVTQDDGDDDGGDCYGPLPVGMAPSQAHVALEERALQMKLDQLAPQTPIETGREEWMIELPTVQAANLGLGPRQFRAKAGPDLSDRSSWTDTPHDKSKKKTKAETEKPVDLKKESEILAMQRRDEEQEAMVKKAKKKNKRDKSLMEQHQEKLNAKKKADKDQGTAVRRPFNRDTDLKVNQFDDAQKKAIMKKARLLDDRFSHGQTKYL